ncbi:ATP-binding cassette sub-family G member 1 [Orchesella cincta]|uniref:ATP-binding cassette sub-family G member 1 n=1 Tax=Orchesella cincta TaxID=48709 RepID=A0A1D2NI12_ORCCI|nr:ATP-binding cassette sub-family G member 1 [Orchesella cincta]
MAVFWNNLNFNTDGYNIEKVLSALSCCCGFRISNQEILKKSFGSIKRGELVALLGPSGAGKSTLLNCLMQGRSYKGCTGGIFVTGLNEPVRVSFINQNEREHLLLSLTVSQSLQYASLLKNPRKTPNAVHKEIVKRLLIDLGLESCANTTVAKCSGGQMKRLAFGLELAAMQKPHFLMLDEVTSGLDSCVGLKVVKLLSNLAVAHNMAVVATIHQPSYKLFTQFSKAIILTGTGDIIFNGEPTKLKGTLELSGYQFEEDSYENPADVVIELASSMKRKLICKSEQIELSEKFVFVNLVEEEPVTDNVISDDSFEGSSSPESESEHVVICSKMVNKLENTYTDFIHDNFNMDSNDLIRQDDGLCSKGRSFSFYRLWILFLRCAHTSIFKQKQFLAVRLALHVVVAVVLAALYSKEIGLDDSCATLIWAKNGSMINPESRFNDLVHKASQNESDLEQLDLGNVCRKMVDVCSCPCVIPPDPFQGPQKPSASDNVRFHFFSLLFLTFASLMPTVLTFSSEIKLFFNERRNGWYTTSTYYVAKTVTEIPFQILFPSMYVYFIYSYTNQPGMDNWGDGMLGFMSTRYQDFLGVTIICCFIAQGLGFLIGILCVRSFNISIIVSSSLLLFLFLFSGFFVKRVDMSESVSWITYLSFVRFGIEAILLSIYGEGRCSLPKESSVLLKFELKDEDFRFNISALLIHLIVIRLLAYLVLTFKASPVSFNLSFKWLGDLLKWTKSGIPDSIKNIVKRYSCKLNVCCVLILFVISIAVYIAVKRLG